MAHEFACSACGFQVRSEDDSELIQMVRTHADDQHDLKLARQDVKDGWREVDVAADD